MLWFILLQFPIGALSSYRRWVQIKDLTLSSGPAVLRASSVGRPQWMRVPPATIREEAVTIQAAR